MDSCDQVWWSHESEHKENNIEEPIVCTNTDTDLIMNNTLKVPSYSIRKMDSSDRNEWLQEAEKASNNERSSSYAGSNSCSESTKSNSTSSKGFSYGIRKMDSSDRNRWLQESDQEDDDNEKSKSYASSISNSEPIKSNTYLSRSPTYDVQRDASNNTNHCWLDDDKRELNVQNSTSDVYDISNPESNMSHNLPTKNQIYSVRKMDSFDTPWWLKEEKSASASDESKLSSINKVESKSDNSFTKSPEMTTMSYGVRKMDSFDSPWWLSGDDSKNASSLHNGSITNQRIEESPNEPISVSPENNDNQWWLENGHKSQLETDLPQLSGDSDTDENDENYLDSKKLEPWKNDYPSIRKADSSESNWWDQDNKHTDTRSTSISIDWSRDGPDTSNQLARTPVVSPSKTMLCVRKMDSLDSPSWLASEESESQSHEPKQTSSGGAVSSSSKHVEELADSSTDWWGEKNQSDDFVRTKRTSLRIKKIENVASEDVVEERAIKPPPKEPNLQDELDQLMLFIGGCRNIDDLLGNEEPPPAAPKTPADSDSGENISFL